MCQSVDDFRNVKNNKKSPIKSSRRSFKFDLLLPSLDLLWGLQREQPPNLGSTVVYVTNRSIAHLKKE